MPKKWILAFDASCCRCQSVANKVKQSGASKVDITPLTDPEVVAWRARALGEDAPHAPTLIRVNGTEVAAWTGVPMALRLAALLGPSATMRLLRALGELKRGPVESGTGRRRFLRLTGAGVAAAVLAGKTSMASADTNPAVSAAKEWAKANKDNLPTRLAEFSRHDLAHRKAIFNELPAAARSRLWVEHLEHYRATHTGLTAEQHQVIASAIKVASQESVFADKPTAAQTQQLEELEATSKAAFGKDEARAVLATLGPQAAAVPRECICNSLSDYCPDGFNCQSCPGLGGNPCRDCWCTDCTSGGCGRFWIYPCNGVCNPLP